MSFFNITVCQCFSSESSYKAETLGSELKEEKSVVKGLKTELQQLKEELFDVKNEKEAIDKVGVAHPKIISKWLKLIANAHFHTTCMYVHVTD